MASHLLFLLSALAAFSASTDGSSFSSISTSMKVLSTKATVVGTNSSDVKGLTALQNKFYPLQTWTGDPCLGFLPWFWVQCTDDPTSPRITALKLAFYGLSGSLPDFSSMDALESIDMSYNSLIGPIPDFLGSLPNLQELNLEYNDLSGSIPSSISKNSKLTVQVSGNTKLCVDTSCGKSGTKSPPTSTTPYNPSSPATYRSGDDDISGSGRKKVNIRAIVGAVVSVVVLIWIVVGVVAILHHKRKSAAVAALCTAAANNPQMKDQRGGDVAHEQANAELGNGPARP